MLADNAHEARGLSGDDVLVPSGGKILQHRVVQPQEELSLDAFGPKPGFGEGPQDADLIAIQCVSSRRIGWTIAHAIPHWHPPRPLQYLHAVAPPRQRILIPLHGLNFPHTRYHYPRRGVPYHSDNFGTTPKRTVGWRAAFQAGPAAALLRTRHILSQIGGDEGCRQVRVLTLIHEPA